MRKKSLFTVSDTLQLPVSNEPQQASLHDEIRQALLTILRDEGANAAAKASAARTLLEYFDDSKSHHSSTARGSEMSAAELDAAIAAIES
jgi:hypothetical protein